MNKYISINDKIIGINQPVFIIAEAGVNDNGNLEIAKQLVDIAKESGADAVKFQTINPDNLVTKDAPTCLYAEKNMNKKQTHYEMLKQCVMKFDDFIELKKYCDNKGIMFLSTPYSEDAVEFIDKLVPAYKIGSSDINNYPLLKKISKLNKPIIISTGMSDLEEIKKASETITEFNKMVVFLHCTTDYPCNLKDVHLSAMQTIQKELNCLVGYSDHTEGIDVSLMAVKLGAVVIEKHFTLDKNLDGPDHKASLEPDELKQMIKQIRIYEHDINIPKEILGNPIKKPTENELKIMNIARKSIFADKDIKKDEVITKNNIIIKRPNIGLNPKYYYEILSKKVNKDIKKDEAILSGDLTF